MSFINIVSTFSYASLAGFEILLRAAMQCATSIIVFLRNGWLVFCCPHTCVFGYWYSSTRTSHTYGIFNTNCPDLPWKITATECRESKRHPSAVFSRLCALVVHCIIDYLWAGSFGRYLARSLEAASYLHARQEKFISDPKSYTGVHLFSYLAKTVEQMLKILVATLRCTIVFSRPKAICISPTPRLSECFSVFNFGISYWVCTGPQICFLLCGCLQCLWSRFTWTLFIQVARKGPWGTLPMCCCSVVRRQDCFCACWWGAIHEFHIAGHGLPGYGTTSNAVDFFLRGCERAGQKSRFYWNRLRRRFKYFCSFIWRLHARRCCCCRLWSLSWGSLFVEPS